MFSRASGAVLRLFRLMAGLGLMAGLMALSAVSPAGAVGFGFVCITGNSAANCAAGEAQISVDVSDYGAGQVLFSFSNAGPAASSITDVYFDDGALLRIASILDGGGVSFSRLARPRELPGAGNIDPVFETTAGFSADSDPPVQSSGVNPGESLGIAFTLVAGAIWTDVLSQLASGELRIGVHVQGYAGGGSESLVNVPEPAGAALLGLGLAALASRRRRSSLTR